MIRSLLVRHGNLQQVLLARTVDCVQESKICQQRDVELMSSRNCEVGRWRSKSERMGWDGITQGSGRKTKQCLDKLGTVNWILSKALVS